MPQLPVSGLDPKTVERLLAAQAVLEVEDPEECARGANADARKPTPCSAGTARRLLRLGLDAWERRAVAGSRPSRAAGDAFPADSERFLAGIREHTTTPRSVIALFHCRPYDPEDGQNAWLASCVEALASALRENNPTAPTIVEMQAYADELNEDDGRGIFPFHPGLDLLASLSGPRDFPLVPLVSVLELIGAGYVSLADFTNDGGYTPLIPVHRRAGPGTWGLESLSAVSAEFADLLVWYAEHLEHERDDEEMRRALGL